MESSRHMENTRQIQTCVTQDNEGINNLSSTSVNSSNSQITNTSHFYYRGVSQPSPAFNTILSSQPQSLYNGVFPSQATFPNQNTFGYNGYSFVDHSPWVSENRIGVANNSQMGDSSRAKNMYTEKSGSLPQGISHSCCTNRMLEHTPMCSPLLLDQFKAASKDMTGCQTKGVSNVDSQTWFYGPSLIGFSNQQSHIENGHFKRNDDFSSCSVSQIGSTPPENIDVRQHPNVSLSNSSFASGNHYSGKSVINCESGSKCTSLEQNKDGMEKYFNVTKLRPNGHVVDQIQQKHHDEHSAIFNSPLEDVLYSHAPLLFHVNNESNQNKGSVHSSYPSKSQSYPHGNIDDLNKTFPSGPDQLPMSHFQTQSRCNLDANMQCEIIESCLSSECKVVGGNSVNGKDGAHSSSDSCQLPLSSNSLLPSDAQSMFNNQQFAQRQGVQCLQTCTVDMCINSNGPNIDDEDKENSNHDSSSVACESDIIVEETGGEEEAGDEVTECESADLLENPVMKCFVCNVSCNSHVMKIRFIEMNEETPLTSATHIPVAKKLEDVLAHKVQLDNNLHVTVICRRCLSLINIVDNLELKLSSAKQDIVQLFRNRSVEEVKWIGESKVFSMEINSHSQIDIDPDSNDVENADITIDIDLNTKSESLNQFNHKANDSAPDVITQPLEEIGNHVAHIGNDDSLKICDVDIKVNGELREQNSVKYKFICEVCAKSFSSKENLNVHKQQHTQQFSYYCDRCGQGFSLRRGLENHLLVHRGEFRFQCEICGKGFIQRHSLEDHLRRHKGTFRFKCKQCSRGFMHRSALRVHMRTHTGERPYMCEHCGRSFSSASNLRVHKHICIGEKPFECDKCDKKFALKAQLTSHIRFHEGQFCSKCEVCGRGFVKEFDYKVHLRTHSGEKPYKCSVCGKCYSSIGNLNQHAKMHNKEKPHKCSLCEKGFLRKTLLVAHMNQHSGERPYKCGQCDKSFCSSHNLLSHSKCHSKDSKRHMCPVCGKAINHSLKVHMRTHSGHKPYKCTECEMAFTVKSTLNKHMRTRHKENVVLATEK